MCGHPHRLGSGRFGLLFVKRGLIPDAGTFARLPGIVGERQGG